MDARIIDAQKRLDAVIAKNPNLGYDGFRHRRTGAIREFRFTPWDVPFAKNAVLEFMDCQTFYKALWDTLGKQRYAVPVYSVKHRVEEMRVMFAPPEGLNYRYISCGAALAAAIDLRLVLRDDGKNMGEADIVMTRTADRAHANRVSNKAIRESRKARGMDIENSYGHKEARVACWYLEEVECRGNILAPQTERHQNHAV